MTSGLYFDCLPFDVCKRIVLHLTGGFPTQEALALARIGPRLREAVVYSVGRKFAMPIRAHPATSADDGSSAYVPWELAWFSNPDYAIAWLQLLKDVVVDFSAFTKYSKRLTIVEDLLKAPQLRKVHIFDKRTMFSALSCSSSIKDLSISLRSKKYGQCMFDALARMNVERLSFDCRSCDTQRSCPFKDSSLFNSTYNALAVSCPNLKALKMWCVYNADCGVPPDDAPVWTIFPAIPSLRELTFNADPPRSAVPHLQRLESVDISWAEEAYDLAMRVGTPIIGIGTNKSLSAEMVPGLARCPRLRRLAVDLEAGAELPLADVFRTLPDLEELALELDTDYVLDNGEYSNEYKETSPGAFLTAVRAAPKLHTVKIMYGHIPLDELQEIITVTGTKLKLFGTSIKEQAEAPLDRLEHLLLHASKHCPNLESFVVTDISADQIAPDEDAEEAIADIYAAVDRLQRTAPLLDIQPLLRTIAGYAVNMAG